MSSLASDVHLTDCHDDTIVSASVYHADMRVQACTAVFSEGDARGDTALKAACAACSFACIF